MWYTSVKEEVTMTDWSEAGRKAWATRRENERHQKMVQAGKKAALTRKRRLAAAKAVKTKQRMALEQRV